MRRLIDADILFDAMEETEWYNNADRDEIAERLIMDAPTIEIIRCGECKYWKSTVQMPNGTEVKCLYGRKADDFCSYGERKDDDDQFNSEINSNFMRSNAVNR